MKNVQISFVTQHFQNKWMVSDQTYTETFLGGDLELIRF